MNTHGRVTRPDWRLCLDPEERAYADSLEEAIAMHRKLMRPLLDERDRLARMAMTRRWRAGAQADAA